ncbi:hypothetical protein VOLCADRAFT_105730 [Volvox carteri f. nagariensis]|uniref:Reverse transcriptase domain-containing protein n=1 Tax=Volvox carteri f. nagariensis TaxID=3068 RepID=D8U2N4_VOLCA|nr:uncharacterized protein VOLCADRAFT_105730 [Volvox carteri f. nagariensis]EFJ45928.1 hypothetical protein VOLCADRAFT_105730 [Volvox carteri f. nagariensis]|eukprot:XP_002953006.1 hypothetical protein VOLCADRAFT_105730 [Volvox carteri f. nagariensis]
MRTGCGLLPFGFKRSTPSRWSTLREQSVSLAGGDLTNLLFVDDVSLVATGHDRAECLLGLLEAYCKATGMAANAAKCEVLIFGGATRERKRLVEAEYRLGGQTPCNVPRNSTKPCIHLDANLVDHTESVSMAEAGPSSAVPVAVLSMTLSNWDCHVTSRSSLQLMGATSKFATCQGTRLEASPFWMT